MSKEYGWPVRASAPTRSASASIEAYSGLRESTFMSPATSTCSSAGMFLASRKASIALNWRLRIDAASPAAHPESVDCACVPITCTLVPFTFNTT